MPELPEAETIARTLAERIAGRRLIELRFLAARARKGPVPEPAGRRAAGVRRYGKRVLIDLGDGLLAVDLRMTGRLLWGAEPGPYTRAVLRFEHGTVCFDDVRQFGSITWMAAPPADLGPDPLEIPAAEFLSRLAGRRGRLKPMLLGQRFLRGIGNIYADEILHRAGIHPRASAARLGEKRALRLWEAMREVLAQAIEAGGSSVSDYVDAEGRPGRFQLMHRVYRREGRACPACGTQIRRIVVAQRGTCYCPRCQR